MRRASEDRRSLPRKARRDLFVHAWLALALLFAQGARVSEILLVQHAICEHGALLHIDAAEARASSDEESEERKLEKGSSAAPFEHEHCDAASILHNPHSIGPSLAPPALLLVAPLAPPSSARHVRVIAVLFQAPKNSPPAAA